MRIRLLTIVMSLGAALACGCGGGGGDSGDPAEPAWNPAALGSLVDNPYLPLAPGTHLVYEGETEEGTERVEVTVSHVSRPVAGVNVVVVVDRAFVDGELVEETFDWFAQDGEGNVWYLGEDSHEIEDGEVVSTDGSWEAGVDGAEGGIVMKASFVPGDSYRQENRPGVAEDMAEIVATDVPLTLENGDSYLTLKIREWNPLEPDTGEFKYYAPGVGLVREEAEDGSEGLELVERWIDTAPEIDPTEFSPVITNLHLPFVPGTTLRYAGETEDGLEEVEVYVTSDIRVVMGVSCRVVRDREYLDGELVEETFDWYAQDDEGNVWYFGEDSTEYEDGVAVSTEGSWEAGVDGAFPGIAMLASPRPGDSYRMEFRPGEAEDMSEVLALEVPVQLESGAEYDCLNNREWNPLEPDSDELKYFAPGIGLVLEMDPDGEEPIQLVAIEFD